VLFLIVLILCWQLSSLANLYPEYLFPSPLKVFSTIYHGFSDTTYLNAVLNSLRRVIQGYLLAITLGISLGLLISRYRYLSDTIGTCLTALQSIPSVAWVPLALLWFGISESAVLFIVVLEAFIPASLGTQNSIKNIPNHFIQAARSLGARSEDLYLRVIIPAILPELITSLRLSWAFAWRALIAGELFVAGSGIGQTLELGRSLTDMSQVLAMILIIAIIGYLSDNIFFNYLEQAIKKNNGQLAA
jgi:NitT/TauT family transport system permease protein